MFTTDAPAAVVREILSSVQDITDAVIHEPDHGLVTAEVKTGSSDIYAVSRSLFFAFADRKQALLELKLQKASLEDIFIELTDDSDPAAQADAAHPESEVEQA